MKRDAAIAAFLILPSLIHSAAGQVKPVACDPALVLEPQELQTYIREPSRPREGAGTVHPRAAVAMLASHGRAIAVAVDSRKADAKALDVVRLDFSGKGEFAGKPVVDLKAKQEGGNVRASFGPATVRVRRGRTTIPVTVRGSYYQRGDRLRRLSLEIGAALEGRCRFGRRTCSVRIVDGNANFIFGDKAKLEASGGQVAGVTGYDTLAIDTADGAFGSSVMKAYYGHPVLVDGTWYDVMLSPDGTGISARPSAAPMAKLKIPHEDWSARLAGEKHILNLRGSGEPVAVPADRYTVLEYCERTAADANRQSSHFELTWVPHRRGEAGRTIDAAAGRTVEVAIGTPLTARIAAEVDGRTVKLGFSVVDASGATVDRVYLPGPNWAQARFEVLDAAGKQVQAGRFGFR